MGVRATDEAKNANRGSIKCNFLQEKVLTLPPVVSRRSILSSGIVQCPNPRRDPSSHGPKLRPLWLLSHSGVSSFTNTSSLVCVCVCGCVWFAFNCLPRHHRLQPFRLVPVYQVLLMDSKSVFVLCRASNFPLRFVIARKQTDRNTSNEILFDYEPMFGDGG